MNNLLNAGIQTQVHYIPIHFQPYYQRYFGKILSLPVSESFYDKTLSLPLHMKIDHRDVLRVTESLAEAIPELL